jgi:hypothetical protein
MITLSVESGLEGTRGSCWSESFVSTPRSTVEASSRPLAFAGGAFGVDA